MLSSFMWSLSSILSSRAPSPWASCYFQNWNIYSIFLLPCIPLSPNRSSTSMNFFFVTYTTSLHLVEVDTFPVRRIRRASPFPGRAGVRKHIAISECSPPYSVLWQSQEVIVKSFTSLVSGSSAAFALHNASRG